MLVKDNKLDTSFWSGKKVFITGHTGFKGSWLFRLLSNLDCEVHGFSLAPEYEPNIYSQLSITDGSSTIGDITNQDKIEKAILEFQPEIVFHMAAQPLVRFSYRNPKETFLTNVIGTQNVLESIRKCSSVKVVINITTDKVYQNKEWEWAYREDDRLGGKDPYSASKACAELLTSSYRDSFFSDPDACKLITVRAGNVIGGGDWSEDRLIPDAVRAFSQGDSLQIRNPYALRPWQHVIEPIVGYSMLAQNAFEKEDVRHFAWNFGPYETSSIPVGNVIELAQKYWRDNTTVELSEPEFNPHEANLLKLDSARAIKFLNWEPRFNVGEAIKMTINWYKNYYNGESVEKLIDEDIQTYFGLFKV